MNTAFASYRLACNIGRIGRMWLAAGLLARLRGACLAAAACPHRPDAAAATAITF